MDTAREVDCVGFRDEMASFPLLDQPAERHLEILCWLTRLSLDLGCERPILVGGGAIEIYTDAHTATGDIDLISPDVMKLGACFLKMGFRRCPSQRYWYHPAHAVLIEFTSDKLREGEQTITIPVDGIDCLVVSPEDVIVDRLESFEATGGGTHLVQAYLVYKLFCDVIDQERFMHRVKTVDVLESYRFIRILRDDAESGLSIDEQGQRLSGECRRRKGDS